MSVPAAHNTAFQSVQLFWTARPWPPRTDGSIVFARRHQCATETNSFVLQVQTASRWSSGFERVNMYHPTKFHEERSNRCLDGDFTVELKQKNESIQVNKNYNHLHLSIRPTLVTIRMLCKISQR